MLRSSSRTFRFWRTIQAITRTAARPIRPRAISAATAATSGVGRAARRGVRGLARHRVYGYCSRTGGACAPAAPNPARSPAISSKKHGRPTKVVNDLVRAVRARAGDHSPDDLEHILRRLLDRGVPEEVRRMDADALAGLVRWIHDFHLERVAGEPRIRIVEPSVEREGWDLPFALIVVATEDRPFLVDSVTMAITESGLAVRFVFHPQFAVERDDAGRRRKFLDAGDGGALQESLMTFWIERPVAAELADQIIGRIETALADVEAAVTDWRAMQARAEALAEYFSEPRPPIKDADRRETRAFLEWLAHHHFTLLGYREYDVAGAGDERALQLRPASGLGILRRRRKQGRRRSVPALERRLRDFGKGPVPLIFTKTDARSTVHRRGHMDYVGVLHYDADGHIVGESRFVGLYTSNTYHRSAWQIPFVRRKADTVLKRSGLRSASHGGKALANILETLPRDELFQSTVDELYELAMGILELEARARTRLFIRRDHVAQFFSCLVFVPRERFNTEARLRIQRILRDHLGGAREDFALQLGESDLVRIHFIVRPDGQCTDDYDVEAIEQEIIEAVRSWHDRMRDMLIEHLGEAEGMRLAQRYEKALPAAYIEEVPPRVAFHDLVKIDRLRGPADMAMSLYRPRQPRFGVVRFKVFKHDHTIPLSLALPMLENMGLRALTERPYELRMEDGERIWIQDFDLVPEFTDDFDIDQVREPFQEAFEQVWRERCESDGFNRLILAAHMTWRQAALVRALCKYLLQTGVPFSQAYMEDTLGRHPLIARLLIELFDARFEVEREAEKAATRRKRAEAVRRTFGALAGVDAAAVVDDAIDRLVAGRAGARAEQIEACTAVMADLLDRVDSLDEDRILRSFAEVVDAIVRTNYYRRDAQGHARACISFKLESARVPDLPRPLPLYEIFVYSPRVEGIHLRGGTVARGGLRWSDRREDFRTEVLGLMKAQSVKNTMIVPVGAKGGFVSKQPPGDGDRDAVRAEGVACYQQFIHGLLDVTDNLEQGAIVHPPQVVRHDEPDPYLVVAADKGTAAFSDIANAVAAEHGFWLGDAFASGGSNGYDHKGMGITARGAWESVKRHFRELGTDCQREAHTAVGVGDMAGDVFGNAMLLSKHTRLIAAFNHLHIFIIDPDPDPAAHRERKRLFRGAGGWGQYNPARISAGGGVWPRSAKSIRLPKAARAALGIEAADAAPHEIVAAILRAPVDLLWLGGIGTYVKARAERDEDVGDRANRLVRINADELRCRVIGEGANLGCTQAGRVDYALNGGMINTDFIDNSAGVDCSDHEVNIKILLNAAVEAGELDERRRSEILAAMTDEVAALVLRNNYLQGQAISMMSAFSAERLGTKAHFIDWLEAEGHVDRALEHLPEEETLAERAAEGKGLVRPELAVLLSYAKITLYPRLLESDVPEDPHLAGELIEYFPTPLREQWPDLMRGHRLWREIIATQVTNSVINRMGATFVLRMQEDTGAEPAAVARAYTIAREVFAAEALWHAIEALDNRVETRVQTGLLLRVWELLRHATRWLLNLAGHGLDVGASVNAYRPGVAALMDNLDDVLVAAERSAQAEAVARLTAQSVPAELARRVAALDALYPALDIVDIANDFGLRVENAGAIYARVGERFGLKWLRECIERLPVDGAWHANARGSLRADLYDRHRRLVECVIPARGDATPGDAVDHWIEGRGAEASRVRAMITDMQRLAQVDYPTVVVALRALEQLVAGTRRH